ncbi:hypothetical protein MR798_01210, partial [bacterium]|nr:hypothetical protein [bacterium]
TFKRIYAITAQPDENGTVTPDKTTAAEGETVTLKVAPNEGFAVDEVTITKANAEEGEDPETVTVGEDNTATFKMPASDVTVEAKFSAEPSPEPSAEAQEEPEPLETASRAGEAHGAPAKESELTCLVAVTCNVCGHTFFVTDPEIKHENGQYTAVYHDHSSIYGARPETTPMYRLYNPNSGEHFFTADVEEKDHLVDVGWDDEGIAWYAPVGVGDPVYRLYNRYGGEHHYTIDEAERDMLIEAGWNDEGVGWYTYGTEVPIYRVYNPNEYANNHHYTADKDEIDTLLAIPAANPWRDEGICWYGMAQ